MSWLDDIVDTVLRIFEPLMNLAIKYWWYVPIALLLLIIILKFNLLRFIR